MTRWLPALLFCVACGPQVLCRTTHGLELLGPLPPVDQLEPGDVGFTCAAFERAEAVTLQAFDQQGLDPRLHQAGASFEGYQVTVRGDRRWALEADPDVQGTAWCDSQQVEIGNSPFLQGALAHELAHVAQHCEARGPLEASDRGHSHWTEDGIRDALAQVLHEQFVTYWANPACYVAGKYVGPADGSPCGSP